MAPERGGRKPIYIFTPGRLMAHEGTLALETSEGKRHFPKGAISEIYVFAEVDLNKGLLEVASKEGILLHFYSYTGWYSGSYVPIESNPSGAFILRQAEHCMDLQKRIVLAKSIAKGEIQSFIDLLSHHQRRGLDSSKEIATLELCKDNIEIANNIPSIMGSEGEANATYFSILRQITSPDFAFNARSRRPPQDPFNAAKSFLNSLLYSTCLAQIYRTHLDPRIGFLHETNFRRHSLNLDIAESFKAPLVDRLILRLINLKQLQQKDFEKHAEGVWLTNLGRRKVTEEWEKVLQTTYRHTTLKRNVSYRTAIRLDLYKLEGHLLGDREFAPFRLRW